MLTHLFNGIFLLAFVLSAIVQYNDPDPLAWIIIYSVAVCMCIAKYFDNLPRWLPPALLLTSLGWIVLLLPGVAGQASWAEIFESISMKTEAVEEAREIGGLAFIALWALVLTLTAGKASKAQQA